MKIDSFVLGAYQTNCYILRESQAIRDCLVVDTGLEAGELVDFLWTHKLNPVAAVLTHGHVDHITGLAEVREKHPDMKVYIHKLDAELLTPLEMRRQFLTGPTKPPGSMSAPAGIPFNTSGIIKADLLIEEGDVIELAGVKLRVIHTPGHTPGGVCLYSEDEGIIFVGDTLFADSIGRTDLGGNMTQLIKSIKEKLLALPDDTVVYPGHGPTTTIAQEKAHNPFLQ